MACQPTARACLAAPAAAIMLAADPDRRIHAMPAPIDLAAYFDRIHWRGPAEPTYATLAGLLEAHTAAIPFENFDVLLGRPVRLDLPALQAKLIGARRGGYCFEHATLFAAVLEAIGFAPQRHAARVTIFQPAAEAPRTHMFLTVPLAQGRYVVDPGFGLFGARQPLPLDGPGTATHRMAQQDGAWVLYATRDGTPFPAWVSTLDIEHPIDAEVANHYVATHPGSPFTTMILASAITPGGPAAPPCAPCWPSISASTCQPSKPCRCPPSRAGPDARPARLLASHALAIL
jgi:N-hydroxyarylamine O-acetyltransferase